MTASHAVHHAEAALVEADIPVMRLLAGPTEKGVRLVLVPRQSAARAGRALEATGWRHRAGHRGLHRFGRNALFAWDGGTSVGLLSGLPAAPLPSTVLSPLEERVWSHAREVVDGVLEPDPVAATLVAAVQVVRPGFPLPAWRRELVRLAGRNHDRAEEVAAANELGLAASLSRAWRLVGLEPLPGPPRLRPREHVWRASRVLQRASRSRRLAALLDGAPMPGHAVFRTRFADVEVDSGRGVFLPVAFSEELLRAGLDRVGVKRCPTVVEVGTGCGAIALGFASARPDADVHAIDVSRRALRWARGNAGRLGLGNVQFERGSLLEPLSRVLRGRVDVLLTNVPYVPPTYRRASWSDTPGAVEGEGDDGLGLPIRLAHDARGFLSPEGWLVAQIADEQVEKFGSCLGRLGYVDFTVTATRASDAVVVARMEDSVGSSFGGRRVDGA